MVIPLNRAGQRAASILSVLLLTASTVLLLEAPSLSGEPTRALPSKWDLSPKMVYHPASAEGYSGEACVQMIFDFHGPSVTQQDIRNVTKGRIDDGEASQPPELIRAVHFSSQSFLSPTQRGYVERSIGYGGFENDWGNDMSYTSPRYSVRFSDIMTVLFDGHPVAIMTYLDMPPELGAPEPPDPQNPQIPNPTIGLDDLASLEKVWRLLTGYESNGQAFYVFDPLPTGSGYLGGGGKRTISRADLDKLWNVTVLEDGSFNSHRYGVTGSPWELADVKTPRTVEAGIVFTISANVTYRAPPNMDGLSVTRSQVVLDTPEEYTVLGSGPVVQVPDVGVPGSFKVVEWTVMAPERSYAGQDKVFFINATGTVISDTPPRHTDIIGEGIDFEIEAFGFLNHPPVIISSRIDPALVPDDGSIEPLVTAAVSDQDGNVQVVQVDLTPVGGPSTQRMFDDGSNGDVVPGDGTHSYRVQGDLPQGEHIIKITAKDTKGGKAYSNLSLVVEDAKSFTEAPRISSLGFSPTEVPNDGSTVANAWAIVTDKEDDITQVVVDLSQLGGDDTFYLLDDGTEGDLFPLDGNYSADIVASPTTELGMYQLPFTAYDVMGHSTIDSAWLKVVLPPIAPKITSAEADPREVPNDGRTKVRLGVTVEDENEDIVEVTADLTPVKGPAEAGLRNDGKGGDLKEGDDVWTLEFTIPSTVSPGLKGAIGLTVFDSKGLTGTGSFSLTVLKANSAPEIGVYSVRGPSGKPQSEFLAGEEVTVYINITDPDNDALMLSINFTELPLSDVPMKDDGTGPDEAAQDGVFTAVFTVPEGTSAGGYNITVLADDLNGGKDQIKFRIYVITAKDGDDEKKLSVYLYFGIPSAGVIVMLVFFVLIFLKRTAPTAVKSPRAPPYAPYQQPRAQMPVFQPYAGPR